MNVLRLFVTLSILSVMAALTVTAVSADSDADQARGPSANPVVSWEPERLSVTITPGIPEAVDVDVRANVDYLSGTVFVVPEIENFITPDAEHISVGSDDPYTLELTFLAGHETEPGTYDGSIHLRDGNRTLPRPLPVEVEVLPSPGVTWQKLAPDGYLITASGAAIAASGETLDEPIDILIDVVDDPTDQAPIPDHLAQSNEFFSISASRLAEAPQDEYFMIGLPVPESADPDNLIMLAMIKPEHIIEQDHEHGSFEDPEWIPLFGSFDDTHDLMLATFPTLLPEEMIFTLVEHPDNPLHQGENSTQTSDGAFALLQSFDGQIDEDPGFLVMCDFVHEFDPGMCGDVQTVPTKDVLDEFAVYFVEELGFKRPRLQRFHESCDLPSKECEQGPYVYFLYRDRDPDLDDDEDDEDKRPGCASVRGAYVGHAWRAGTCIIQGATGDDLRFGTSRHELLHAIQAQYDPMHAQDDMWVWEGTASIVHASPFDYVRSSRHPLPITAAWGVEDRWRYTSQDLWIFLMERYGPDIDYLISVYEAGSIVVDGQDRLADVPEITSLADAYWDFVKNQAFEKQTEIPDGWGSTTVPAGPTCSFNQRVYQPHFVEDVGWRYEGPPSVEFVPDQSGDTWLDASLTSIERLQSDVLEITLHPADFAYEIAFDANVPDEVQYKFYGADESNSTSCVDEDLDNSARMFAVSDEPLTVYALVSNMNLDPGNEIDAQVISSIPFFKPDAEDIEVTLEPDQETLIIDPLPEADDFYDDPLDLDIIFPTETRIWLGNTDDDDAGEVYRISKDGRHQLAFEPFGPWFGEVTFEYRVENSQERSARGWITIVQSPEITAHDVLIELTPQDLLDAQASDWDYSIDIQLEDSHVIDPVGDWIIDTLRNAEDGTLGHFELPSGEDRTIRYWLSEDASDVHIDLLTRTIHHSYQDAFEYQVSNSQSGLDSANVIIERPEPTIQMFEPSQIIEPVPDHAFVDICHVTPWRDGGYAGTLLGPNERSKPFIIAEDGEFRQLGGLDETGVAIVHGVDDEGLIVGTAYDNGIPRPVVWDSNFMIQDLLAGSEFSGPGFATGLNNSGEVTGFIDRGGTIASFVWRDDEIFWIGDMLGDEPDTELVTHAMALGLNDGNARTLIGATGMPPDPGGRHVPPDSSFCDVGWLGFDDIFDVGGASGFAIDFAGGRIPPQEPEDAVITPLDPLGGLDTVIPTDVNDDGWIVGTSATGIDHDGQPGTAAVIWAAERDGTSMNAHEMGFLGEEFFSSEAHAINKDGLAVGTAHGDGFSAGFAWGIVEGQRVMIDLNEMVDDQHGLTIVAATEVTDDNQIIAWAKNGEGDVEPYLLEPGD